MQSLSHPQQPQFDSCALIYIICLEALELILLQIQSCRPSSPSGTPSLPFTVLASLCSSAFAHAMTRKSYAGVRLQMLSMQMSPRMQKAKTIAAVKAPAAVPAAAAAAVQAMPAGSAAQDGLPAKPKAAPRAQQKAPALDAAHVEAKVKQMYVDGLQHKLSVPEIKAFLKARKQPLGGKKADLLVRLSAALSGSGT